LAHFLMNLHLFLSFQAPRKPGPGKVGMQGRLV